MGGAGAAGLPGALPPVHLRGPAPQHRAALGAPTGTDSCQGICMKAGAAARSCKAVRPHSMKRVGLQIQWVRVWQGCVLQVLLWDFQGMLICHALIGCLT